MIRKLLCVVPHLSTGGCPQFLVKKIELLRDQYDIHVVEWVNQTGGVLVVQRNKVLSLIPDHNFYSINKDEQRLIEIIDEIKPEVIHFEELPETFISTSALKKIYKEGRSHKIVETTHDSSFSPTVKRFLPDKFFFVSAYNAFKYINLDVPFEIIEYPVEEKQPDKAACRKSLGFEDDYYHVLNVGLFTERKNQAYLFDIARRLKHHKIKFHFVGNQADNFKAYWEPLMRDKPDNCVIWGERTDVADFIQASDLFFFASKGDRNNKELNPIAIKEAIEYRIPMMMFNLDVYCGKYDNNSNITFITGDLESDSQLLLSKLNLNVEGEIIIIGTYPNTEDRISITKDCIKRYKSMKRPIMLVSHYPVDLETQGLVDYYLFDKWNPLIAHSYWKLFYNYTNEYDVNINLNGLKHSNQSLAVLTNLFNGFKTAKQMGFKKAFYTTYDVLLHDLDKPIIDEGFEKLSNRSAYLSNTPSPLGKGVETTAMWFNIEFFLSTFDDVKTEEEYNSACRAVRAENFLEHYMFKKIQGHENVDIIDIPGNTHLVNTGRGIQSYSEYFSILPIEGELNLYMLYFYTYNIDNRKVKFSVDGKEDLVVLKEQREYKREIKYSGKPIKVSVSYIDQKDTLIKEESYEINESFKKRATGSFKWKGRKPKVKLVHLQTTVNDQREELSRASLSSLTELNYKQIQNEPYKDLPPIENCARPDCVSMTKFESGHPKEGQALTPSHYGCFKSFKDAILNEFDKDLDFLILCEGDCLLEVSKAEFIEKVYKACEIANQQSIDYLSFGDTVTLEEGWLQSKVVEEIPGQDLLFITDKIIGIQCIMFNKRCREYLLEKLETQPWEAADIFFNIIFGSKDKKMAILKKRITTQADGYSLIDKSLKIFRK